MSAVLGVAAIVGLFVVFGALAVADRGRGCHDCSGAGEGGCGTCDREEVDDGSR